MTEEQKRQLKTSFPEGEFQYISGSEVTEPEPLPAKDPLWDAPNLLLTPHISGGYHMKKVFETIFEITLENLKKYRVGEALRNQVDRKVGY